MEPVRHAARGGPFQRHAPSAPGIRLAGESHHPPLTKGFLHDHQDHDGLFIHELSDMYSAEKQMTRSLPRMARASSDPQLAEAFERHLEETQGQVERIDQIVEQTGIKLKRVK